MKPFLTALDDRVLVCDGAMGTMLYAKGVFINRCFESLNQTQPDLVVDVHCDYLKAGADVVETNTFGANRMKLRGFGLGDQVRDINLAGATLARRAVEKSGQPAYVAGAIGPIGVRIEPWGKTGVDEAEAMFREQAQALVDGQVDLFILETFRDLNEIGAAIAAVRSVCDLPIVAQMTTEEDGASLDGAPPEQFAPDLIARGASVVGVNCSVGPAPMLETIERISDVTDVWLSAQPNAGRPRDIEGRNLYLCSPEYMASYARRFIASGVRLVGGCCGTTPEHIRQIALAAKSMAPGLARHAATADVRTPVASQPNARPALPRESKSIMGRKLANGGFIRAIELVPPRGHAASAALADAARLAKRGVDVVTIPDGPRSGARMSALSLAVLVQQHAAVEVLLQYSCRDRNLLGIQSDLLGAHAMGVRNLLGITGDVRSLGDIPDATAVFDVDSIGLTNVIARLNHGLDIGGQSIGEPTSFHTGVMVNPSRDLDQELRRLEFKVEAGAEFAVTRPVFDVSAFERFLARVTPLGVPIIVGIWPFESALNAEFMANEVPGVTVPDALVERMRRTTSADAAAAEGVKVARELVAAIKGMAAGVQISTPSGRLDAALDVLDVV
ncbi:MAG: bifunctional homocysteine S-methyltransferase/methylenetetrahydrofolate reductase [Acidobacteria bacterium]|nr:bifunctional homocysteine S-methyltransferase/methylenetetrahydrofolate reductase [Acidobacteriota bacterium]MSO60681.1 bifunctional homocysteine S-methyltransferase/methylenetetrahydrofolate reductase [Acidobacteriota bacterium]